jgi:hypothetical protein
MLFNAMQNKVDFGFSLKNRNLIIRHVKSRYNWWFYHVFNFKIFKIWLFFNLKMHISFKL